MEVGAHVWLRSPSSEWGWVPARIADREETTSSKARSGSNSKAMVKLTLTNDTGVIHTPTMMMMASSASSFQFNGQQQQHCQSLINANTNELNYFTNIPPFEREIFVDAATLANADHPDIKLRNLPSSYQLTGGDPEASVISSPSTKLDTSVVGGVHDLIGLTHLHEPAILHALRLRYDADIIYTSTGPILIAVNPFQRMDHLYSSEVMERYRLQGEGIPASASFTSATPFKNGNHKSKMNGSSNNAASTTTKLPPHVYKTADDAYRSMKRGLENSMLMQKSSSMSTKAKSAATTTFSPSDQSILVSGESGAGKTVTTKIVLNYFAMLSKQIGGQQQQMMNSPRRGEEEGEMCIEQQVLQSNTILEAFGNARTLRNDNSSRFGKYIDIRFTASGKLSGAKIETYLLEKVRLIHPSAGERNYHIFYQFLEAATVEERIQLGLDKLNMRDFKLLNGTGTYDRRDGVVDGEMHLEMLDAMVSTIPPLRCLFCIDYWKSSLIRRPSSCLSRFFTLVHHWLHIRNNYIPSTPHHCHPTLR
jgi:myosin-5